MILAVRGQWENSETPKHEQELGEHANCTKNAPSTRINPSYETAVLTEALLSNDSKAH